MPRLRLDLATGCALLCILSACGNPAPSNNAAGNTAEAGKPKAEASAPADPELVELVANEVRDLSARAPIRVDSVTTMTGVRASGSEIIYQLAISQVIPGDQLEKARDTMQAQNQRNLCANSPVRTLLARGGAMSHHYTDASGQRFETRVTSCPGT